MKPRNEMAEEAYRHNHLACLIAKKNGPPQAVQYFEKRMDELQPQIADGPDDPRWIAFFATLPTKA